MKKPSTCKKITIPGFSFSGIGAGIKKTKQKDLALIFSELPATASAVFTTNRIKAAPVKLGIKQIKNKRAQAVIINSGNANACTGEQGLKDARAVKNNTARTLGISPSLVYVSSTGIIGRKLPTGKIIKALPELKDRLSPRSSGDTAIAIMTTDTFPKTLSKKIRIGGKIGTIGGIVKGAGMICPDMATMLCYICTDISIAPGALDIALKEAVGSSFNRISVDNDMSTNDTVMIMANGMLGNRPLTESSPDFKKFKMALNELTYNLAEQIVMDGEGATKIIEVVVKGAGNDADAEKAAISIANSMLVKTAIHGKDPNWGRIISAAGYSGAKIKEDKTDIYINRVKVLNNGLGTNRTEAARKALLNDRITITVDLGAGTKSAKRLTSDLTKEYIRINAEYET